MADRKKHKRQRAYVARMVSKGRCPRCGKVAEKYLCVECKRKRRALYLSWCRNNRG